MNKEDKVEVRQESRMASSEIRRKSGMDSSEVYKKYLIANRRFCDEKVAIQKEYIASHYNFTVGDVVIFKNIFHKTPTTVVIDSLYFEVRDDYPEEHYYKKPHVYFRGRRVDEEGYDIPLFIGSKDSLEVIADADDVIEITNIIPKGTRR